MAIPVSTISEYEPDHKIFIPTGSYNATIVDEWVRWVTQETDGTTWSDGRPKIFYKYSREKTKEQRITIKVTLDDDPSICLKKEMGFFNSQNALYAKTVERLTGIAAGSPDLAKWDSVNLRGMKVSVSLIQKGIEENPYTELKEIAARPKALARPAVRPTAQPAVRPASTFTPADAAKLGIQPSDDLDEVPF